ncbi:MAG: hypothetical protein AAF596_09545 [Planctomycetota bacterium]
MSSVQPLSEARSDPASGLLRATQVVRKWRAGGVVALDQLLFSGTNFASAVLLGRFAGPRELGLYSLVLASVFMLSGYQRALVISPYTFQAPRLTGLRRRLRRGSTALFAAAASMATGAAVLAGWTLFAPSETAGVAGWVAAAVAIGWCLRDSFRRLLFADHRYREAAILDGVAAVAQLAALGVLGVQGRLTASSALAVVAVVGLASGLAGVVFSPDQMVVAPRRLLKDLRSSWLFGRWSAGSELIHAGQDALAQALLTLGGGLAATGVYAACSSVVRLANPFLHAMGNAAGPVFARALAEEGIGGLRTRVRRLTRLTLAAMSAFVLLTALFGPLLLAAAYGDDYTGNIATLVALAAAAALSGVGMIPAKAISSLETPRWNFFIGLVGLLVVLAVAGLGVGSDALTSVAAALVVGAGVCAALRWWCFCRLAAATRPGGAP